MINLDDNFMTSHSEDILNNQENIKEKKQKKSTKGNFSNNKRKIIKRISIIVATIIILLASFTLVFFKTDVFAKYRDTWVITAMNTSSHQWLAEWFLSDEEIQAIMEKYQVENNSNSSADSVTITSSGNGIKVEDISGDNYQGYVAIIDDPSRVNLVDSRSGDNGTLLSQTVSSENAVLASNAGGFNWSKGGKGHGRYSNASSSSEGTLNSTTIIDGKMLYGDEDATQQLIGFSKEGKLILGKYNYKEAIATGIDDAITFGPYLIVDGENQVTNDTSGGLQPRTAIGQTKDGKIILVVIEGRSASSLGASYKDLQDIFNKYGAVNAANLDGGGSSEMIYKGEIVNDLSNGNERELPTSIIVK